MDFVFHHAWSLVAFGAISVPTLYMIRIHQWKIMRKFYIYRYRMLLLFQFIISQFLFV